MQQHSEVVPELWIVLGDQDLGLAVTLQRICGPLGGGRVGGKVGRKKLDGLPGWLAGQLDRIAHVLAGGGQQLDGESASFSDHAADADVAPESRRELFHQSQPQTGAAVPAGSASAGLTETLEKLAHLILGDPWAGVFDGEKKAGVVVGELDCHGAPREREAERVGEQIEKDPLENVAVHQRRYLLGGLYPQGLLLARCQRGELFRQATGEGGDVGRLAMDLQLAGRRLGEVEQKIHLVKEAQAVVLHRAECLLQVGVEASRLSEDMLDRAQDQGQRGSQLVADVGQKLVFEPLGGTEARVRFGKLGQRRLFLRDLLGERQVDGLQLGRGAQGQSRGEDLVEGGHGEPGSQSGHRFDPAGQAVHGLVEQDDLHHVGQPTGDDEGGEHERHPRHGKVSPASGEKDQEKRDRDVGQRDQKVGDVVQKDLAVGPLPAHGARNIPAGIEEMLEKFRHIQTTSNPLSYGLTLRPPRRRAWFGRRLAIDQPESFDVRRDLGRIPMLGF